MSKWLKQFLESAATPSPFESEVLRVLPVSNLRILKNQHINKPQPQNPQNSNKQHRDDSTAVQSEPTQMNMQVLKKMEIPYSQNQQNLLDNQSQTVLETPSSASITTDKSKVIPWLTRLKSATTLDALEKLLKEFSAGEWTLIDKRNLSEAYTPIVIKLIDAEQANKWQTLENLASLCWRPTHHG